MDEGDYAEMGWLDDNLNPREFYINISHKLKWKNILISLAHEIIHIKQHVKREVFDYLKQINISRWKNKKYNIDIVPYEKRPWEIEAARLDSVLYRKFLLLDIPRSL